MSQEIFDVIAPDESGINLATILNDFKDALMSGLSGTSRPTELQQAGRWIDVTNDPVSWSYKMWTGTDDVELFRIDLATGLASTSSAVEQFSIKRVSADTTGAILKLIKQRIANNGQVLSGDVVGDIRFVGRGDDSSNPVVAKLAWVASDDQTTTTYGGEFQFWSVADGTDALVKHMRFINGLIETILPLKINSLRLVNNNVATTATIAQLTATKSVVEMTGSTATQIQGIKSDDPSQVITIHNRSSANITLKHQNAGAAAGDRLKLPGGLDYTVIPDASATLFLCTTDGRWKLKSTSEKNFFGFTVDTYFGVANTWTAPTSTTTAKIRSYRSARGYSNVARNAGGIDVYGNMFTWGGNGNGQVGDGTVAAKSSPVAVLGGFSFVKHFGTNGTGSFRLALSNQGAAYGWGANNSGQLGDGTVVPKSSPVAVLGGFRFNNLYQAFDSVIGLSTSNLAYAWGVNANGQLGDGSVVPKSSPVAVLGGLRFAKIEMNNSGAGVSVLGLTTSGAAYAWGLNTNGQIGDGTVAAKSSPVAVLGGLTFKNVINSGANSRYVSLGLTPAGVAYAWGANTNSSLGVGDQVPRSSPVAVLGGITFKELYMGIGSESVYGLGTDGVLYAWGDNTDGQLGLGDTANRSSPVAVLGGLTFKKIRIQGNAVFGLTDDGTLYSWGGNNSGTLGLGDVASRSSPTAVLGGFKFADVFFNATGGDPWSTFGVQADGTLYAWGSNSQGSLGVGDVTPRSSPVAVVGGWRPDMDEFADSNYLTVTPGAAYTVNITDGISTFGNVSLGTGIYKVEVEYLQ